MKLIVVSDVHLGYERCDKEAFNGFLDSLIEGTDATDLVLLGDIVDMWRRDASGVFLENMDTMERIRSLQGKLKVHYVAGNHDHHVMHLKNKKSYFRYPFEFKENMLLRDGDHIYNFIHGHELEYGSDPLMEGVVEALCHEMSDSSGNVEEEVWGSLTRDWSEIRYFMSTLLLRKRTIKNAAKRLQDIPETRLNDILRKIYKDACDKVRDRPGEMLIFGHTHRPFINRRENVVNTGSWVTDATPHNTYLEISQGKPRLFVFGGEEIKERVELIKQK